MPRRADFTDIPANEIWYTTNNGSAITLSYPDAFDVKIISNLYEKSGRGIITFDGDVTSIGEDAFSECESLESITIPDSVVDIGDYVFYDCESLTAFYGKYASADNRCLIVDGVLKSFARAGLTTYTIPNGVTSIGEDAFYYCSSLTSITLPDSVTSIGVYAFYGCSSLTTVYSKNPTPPTCGDYSTPFHDGPNLEKIYVPTESVYAYKTAWSHEASIIEGYDFSN